MSEPSRRGRKARPARALKEDTSARRRTLLILAVATVIVALLAAASAYLANRLTPEAVQTTTVTPPPPSATWALELPVTVGEYSRDASDDATPTKGSDGKTTISARYARNGQQAAVVLISRPYRDLEEFMTLANMNAVTPQGEALCGYSGDFNTEGCAIQRDDTAILVVAVGDTSRADLLSLADDVAAQVAR